MNGRQRRRLRVVVVSQTESEAQCARVSVVQSEAASEAGTTRALNVSVRVGETGVRERYTHSSVTDLLVHTHMPAHADRMPVHSLQHFPLSSFTVMYVCASCSRFLSPSLSSVIGNDSSSDVSEGERQHLYDCVATGEGGREKIMQLLACAQVSHTQTHTPHGFTHTQGS